MDPTKERKYWRRKKEREKEGRAGKERGKEGKERKAKSHNHHKQLSELLKVKGKIAVHLQTTLPRQENEKSGVSARIMRSLRWLNAARAAGKRKIVIMLIPHSGKSILSIPVRLVNLWFLGIALSGLVLYSVIQIVDRSGTDVQFYDLGITDKEFDDQMLQMADQMLPMHEVINNYYETLLSISRKMDLNQDQPNVQTITDFADTLSAAQVKEFKEFVETCQAEEDSACKKEENSEEILKQLIYLTETDNEKMRQSLQFFDRILTQMNTDEKGNLFRSIPNSWPVEGYLLRSYGDQFDERLGIRIFKRGIEVGAAAGASVQATALGKVARISYDSDLGLNVLVRHGYGVSTLYGQLDQVHVSLDEEVERGQEIANVGYPNTYPIAALYYEVHIGAVAYDPLAFLNHPEAVWLNNPKN